MGSERYELTVETVKKILARHEQVGKSNLCWCGWRPIEGSAYQFADHLAAFIALEVQVP